MKQSQTKALHQPNRVDITYQDLASLEQHKSLGKVMRILKMLCPPDVDDDDDPYSDEDVVDPKVIGEMSVYTDSNGQLHLDFVSSI